MSGDGGMLVKTPTTIVYGQGLSNAIASYAHPGNMEDGETAGDEDSLQRGLDFFLDIRPWNVS